MTGRGQALWAALVAAPVSALYAVHDHHPAWLPAWVRTYRLLPLLFIIYLFHFFFGGEACGWRGGHPAALTVLKGTSMGSGSGGGCAERQAVAGGVPMRPCRRPGDANKVPSGPGIEEGRVYIAALAPRGVRCCSCVDAGACLWCSAVPVPVLGAVLLRRVTG